MWDRRFVALFVLGVLLAPHAGRGGATAAPSRLQPRDIAVVDPLSASFTPATPAAEPTLSYTAGLGAAVETVAVSATLAYIGEGSWLTILDIQNVSRPTYLTRLQADGDVVGVQISGSYAYLATSPGVFQIIDVSNPVLPVPVASLNLGVRLSDVAVVGSRAYIAFGSNGMQIVDISDPAAPALLGSLTANLGSVTGVVATGDMAYLSTLGGVTLVDVTNPASPTIRSNYSVLGFGNGFGLSVAGSLVYLASGGGGLEIIDVSLPDTPTFVGRLPAAIFGLDVDVVGQRAYVASRESGLKIVDVSDPASPQLVATLETQSSAYAVQIVGDRAYIGAYTAGLVIGDVSVASQPAVLGQYAAVGDTNRVWVAGHLAYVSSGYDGLRIVDLSTPARPLVLSALDLPGWVQALHLDGDRLYVGNWHTGEVHIIDVRDPASPTIVGVYKTTQRAADLEVVGTRLYIAGGGGGLEIVEVSQPESPVLLGRFETTSFARGIRVVGSTVYLATEFSGLEIIDVGDPAHPARLANVPGMIQEVDVKGSFAYALEIRDEVGPDPSGENRLLLIDISNPSAPSVVGSYATAGPPADVGVLDHRVFLVSGPQLQMLDVRNPAQPRLLDSIDFTQGADGVWVDHQLAYVTGYRHGLSIASIDRRFDPAVGVVDASGGQVVSADNTVQLSVDSDVLERSANMLYLGKLRPAEVLPSGYRSIKYFLTEMRSLSGQRIEQPQGAYMLTLRYTDAELAALGVTERSLNLLIWTLDGWVEALPCSQCQLDPVNNELTIRLERLSEFALVAQGPEHLLFLPLSVR